MHRLHLTGAAVLAVLIASAALPAHAGKRHAARHGGPNYPHVDDRGGSPAFHYGGPFEYHDAYNAQMASGLPWHGNYYHTAWGQPIALVVPPVAATHTDWSWGVAQTRRTPLYHQFERPWPGPFGGSEQPFYPTPHWPSNTNQFGVYPVRGPW